MEIKNLYRAGYPLVWVHTTEPARAERELAQELDIPAYHWDVEAGGPTPLNGDGDLAMGSQDPVGVIGAFLELEGQGALFLWNYHHFINSPEVQAALLNASNSLQLLQKIIIVLSPTTSIPVEIAPFFYLYDFRLPDENDLASYLDSFLASRNTTLSQEEKERVVKAGLGLTKFEFYAALALSYEERGSIDPAIVWEQKAQLIRKNPVLELYVPSDVDNFAHIGGLDNLKQFLLRVARSPLSRGVLLVGVPGTGKSAIAKALGNEVGLPVLKLDFGKVFGSLVGESEAKMRGSLKVVDAMSPCVLFIDEIEKGIGGVASSHLSDGGTGARVFGSFLQWLNDHSSQVFVIATSNDIWKLPPEFTRSGRWDAIFFVDLPAPQEREAIWQIWLSHYGLALDTPRPADKDWTGAEIRTACRLAKIFGTSPKDVAQFVVPIATSMGDKISQLREWAKGRTVPASTPQPSIRKRAQGGWM